MNLETERLLIIPLSYDQLLEYTIPGRLEKSLGTIDNGRSVSPKTAAKITENILPKIAVKNPDNVFYTFWIILLKTENVLSAEFCFKGKPNENSEVEIGYATYGEFQNRRIMTESIRAITNWIFENTSVKTIVAETHPDNYMSHKTLKNNNFKKTAEQTDNWIWKLAK